MTLGSVVGACMHTSSADFLRYFVDAVKHGRSKLSGKHSLRIAFPGQRLWHSSTGCSQHSS